MSYVRWVGSNQVISASTDNHLKLWDVAEAAISEGNCAPVTSFTGEGCMFVSMFLAGAGIIAYLSAVLPCIMSFASRHLLL